MNYICGVDLGNITSSIVSSKGSNLIESRIEKATDLGLLGGNDFFELSNTNEIYLLNKCEFENNTYKYEKDNFINILHYLIGSQMPSGNVKLSIGIQASQYNKYRDDMKNKIMNNNKIHVKIGDITKNIRIEDCMVVPEGYGVYKTTDSELLIGGAKTIVIDIGGGSTDLAYFGADGKFEGGESISLGLLDLYKEVQSKVEDASRMQHGIEDIQKYYDGHLKLIGVSDEPKKEATVSSFKALFNRIRGKRKDLAQCNIILCGGGAATYEAYFKKLLPHTIVNKNILANTNAFYLIGVAKWQKRK